MVETITTTLQDELEAQHFDEPIRERLSACLPVLEQAIASWRANHTFSAPDLMIAAATARSGLVLYADGWGDLADGVDQELAVRAIAEAIEAPSATRSTRALTLGLSVVLGESGRRAHAKDAALIADYGELPLLVVVVDPPDVLATTLPVEVAEPPSALLH